MSSSLNAEEDINLIFWVSNFGMPSAEPTGLGSHIPSLLNSVWSDDVADTKDICVQWIRASTSNRVIIYFGGSGPAQYRRVSLGFKLYCISKVAIVSLPKLLLFLFQSCYCFSSKVAIVSLPKLKNE